MDLLIDMNAAIRYIEENLSNDIDFKAVIEDSLTIFCVWKRY